MWTPRVRSWMPPSQLLEQLDHSAQASHSQSTTQASVLQSRVCQRGRRWAKEVAEQLGTSEVGVPSQSSSTSSRRRDWEPTPQVWEQGLQSSQDVTWQAGVVVGASVGVVTSKGLLLS